MEKDLIIKKNTKMKDIMRLFFKYEIEALPVLDKRNKFKGLINKALIIQDAVNSDYIERSFAKLIPKYLVYPKEEDFLLFIAKLPENLKFPIIDSRGEILFLGDKKKLLNSYYSISEKENEKLKINELFYKEILNILPFDMLLTDSGKIIFANKSFLQDFDFDPNILLDNAVNKFFPNINMILTSSAFFPKIHSLTYRHVKWYYSILKYKASLIYIFSLTEEKLLPAEHEEFSAPDDDTVEIKSLRKANPVSPANSVLRKKEKDRSLPDVMRNKERDIIRKVMQDNDWNITVASRILKIPRQTLQYKISKYKIN